MHDKIDWWLIAGIVSAAVARALISPGAFIERCSTALASILFACVMAPAVIEIGLGYSGITTSPNLTAAIGASVAIAAEPIIRHIYAIATNPAAIIGLIRGAKEVLQELFRK